MARMHSMGGSDKAALVRQLLRARQFDARDFDIDEDPDSGLGQLLGSPGGVLTLRRRSTGEIRVYACGPGTAWFAAIAGDLDQGYFRAGSPPRSFRRPPVRELIRAALHA